MQQIGRYEVVGELGRGQHGVVYLAQDNLLQRRVAIKVISAALLASPGGAERLRTEARIMAMLDHPNCVRVFELSEDMASMYLVIEYIDGSSLRRLAERQRLSPEQALGILKGGLAGLAHAHSMDLVHRDVKPDNVLCDLEGVSKLADFGVAVLGDSTSTGSATGGTLAYMSPEQVRGDSVDRRSDIYSCGAMLFELLAGRPPFVADSPVALARQHLKGDVPDLNTMARGLPQEVGAMVARAMALNPEERQQTADEFREELERAAASGYGDDWERRASVVLLVAAVAAAGIALTGATTVGSNVAAVAETGETDYARAAGAGGRAAPGPPPAPSGGAVPPASPASSAPSAAPPGGPAPPAAPNGPPTGAAPPSPLPRQWWVAGIVAVVVLLVIIGIVTVGAVIGGQHKSTIAAKPRPSASSTHQPASPSPAPVAIGDSCIVGRWVEQNESAPGNWTWNNGGPDEVIAVAGLQGLVISFSAGGDETDDFNGTQPLIGDFHGHQIKIVLRGSATFRDHADGSHIVETAAGQGVTVNYYYDGTLRPGGTVSAPANTISYTCGASSLHMESAAGHAGYGPEVDDLTRG
jgi:eukaryotic-like serine/threonine-protein kinase